jgi:hypothetical protein
MGGGGGGWRERCPHYVIGDNHINLKIEKYKDLNLCHKKLMFADQQARFGWGCLGVKPDLRDCLGNWI